MPPLAQRRCPAVPRRPSVPLRCANTTRTSGRRSSSGRPSGGPAGRPDALTRRMSSTGAIHGESSGRTGQRCGEGFPMTRSFRTCVAMALLLTAVPAPLMAQTVARSVEVPQNRPLGAVETMAAAGVNGVDYSANAPSLSGLTLLATIPSSSVPRQGYVIQAQCTAGLTVALDDAGGSLAPTILVLAGASANGGQGGTLDMTGLPHTGRIRIYSSASNCQMAARVW